MDHGKLMMAVAVGILTAGVSARASETDDRIESAARKTYVYQTYLKGDSIKIESAAGVVTLTGTVAGDSHKTMAEDTVKGLPGVKAVHNRLEIKGENAAEKSDAWISARVTSALMFHRNVKGSTTKVNTKDGHVTLTGEATSAAQRDLTAEYVKDVYGVKDVKNEMTLAKVYEKDHKKTLSENAADAKDAVDDASITTLVKMTLLYHRSTSALDTTVKTTDGVVTLGGKAKNPAEKDLATKLISDVYGVKSVVNVMAI
jgi:osmotically-inducible protein OsmY